MQVCSKSDFKGKIHCGSLIIVYQCLHLQGELKLLHDENDMLREQVVSLANQQTNGEVTENSSTESSERLENVYKLYKPKTGKSNLQTECIHVSTLKKN